MADFIERESVLQEEEEWNQELDFSHLHLANNQCPSPPPPCATCGSRITNHNRTKRASPEPTSMDQPILKKSHQGAPFGYSTVRLPYNPFHNPTPIGAAPPALLRRAFSDPVNAQETALSVLKGNGSSSSSLPPLAPTTLPRSVSEPIRRSLAKTGGDLLRISPVKTGGEFSPAKMESPNAKRLLRIQEGMKQMSEWANRIATETFGNDDDDDNLTNSDNISGKLNVCGAHADDESLEEALSVERVGESLMIHFKCPCTKSYEFLLAGGNCFYKLL